MKKTMLLGAGVLLIVAAALHFYLLDGLQGWFFAGGFHEDTVYAKRYSDQGFRQVRRGMPTQNVSDLLGSPLGEVWAYTPDGFLRDVVAFREGRVDRVIGNAGGRLDAITKGMSRDEVLRLTGPATQESWVYSRSAHDQSYRVRVVVLKQGRVRERLSKFYVD